MITQTQNDALQIGTPYTITSWMRRPPLHLLYEYMPAIEDWDSIRAITPEYISLDLYFLTDPNGARKSTKTSCQKARAYFRSQSGQEMLSHINFREVDAWKTCVKPLAAALDCGLEWIARAVEAANAAGSLTLYDRFCDPKADLEAIKRFAKGTSLAKAPINHLKRLQESVLQYIFQICIGSWKLDSSVIVDSKGARALLQKRDCWMAVPAALVGPAFSSRNRVWYLQPVEQDDLLCWKLEGQTLLFGCPDLREHPDYVTLMEGQRIFGSK
jgi:hypothetical protein